MKVFNCILGVFSILGSIYCMFYPGLTFLSTGWLITMLLGVLGICSIFEYFSSNDKKRNKGLIADGVIGLILGIGAAVISVLGIFNPWVRGSIDLMMLIIFAFWLFYSGIISIAKSFEIKKTGSKMWILTLILGVLVLLTGIYGAVHPLFTMATIGYIVGFQLMIYGVRLVASMFEQK